MIKKSSSNGSMTATLKACDTTSEKQCILDLKNVKMTLKAGSNHTPPEMVPVKSRSNDVKIKRTSKNYIVQIKIDKDFSFEKSLQKYSGECMLAFHDVLSDYVSIPKEDVPF